MKLSIALTAAFTGSAAAVYAPPQPKDGQDLMSLWKQVEAEAVFMQNEIALKRSLDECNEDCNLEKEADSNFNRGRCQKNCKQLDDDGVLNDDDNSGDRSNRNGRDQDEACDECCAFGDDGDTPGRRQERCLASADCDSDWCVDWDGGNRSSRRGEEMFYKGMCGNDTDDDLNYVDDFCDDMFGNSGKNICKNPDTDDIDDFCDWLESNSKSFSNRDYFEGQCDGPSNSDKDFCDDIGDELCDFSDNKLTNSQIDLCDWLKDDLSSKREKAEAAASLFKIAPMLRTVGKN